MDNELIIQDFTDVIPGGNESPPGRWAAMFIALDAGRKIRVSEAMYNYFLNVLPPRWMSGSSFLFAEGEPHMFYLFTKVGEVYFAEGVTRKAFHEWRRR